MIFSWPAPPRPAPPNALVCFSPVGQRWVEAGLWPVAARAICLFNCTLTGPQERGTGALLHCHTRVCRTSITYLYYIITNTCECLRLQAKVALWTIWALCTGNARLSSVLKVVRAKRLKKSKRATFQRCVISGPFHNKVSFTALIICEKLFLLATTQRVLPFCAGTVATVGSAATVGSTAVIGQLGARKVARLVNF